MTTWKSPSPQHPASTPSSPSIPRWESRRRRKRPTPSPTTMTTRSGRGVIRNRRRRHRLRHRPATPRRVSRRRRNPPRAGRPGRGSVHRRWARPSGRARPPGRLRRSKPERPEDAADEPGPDLGLGAVAMPAGTADVEAASGSPDWDPPPSTDAMFAAEELAAGGDARGEDGDADAAGLAAWHESDEPSPIPPPMRGAPRPRKRLSPPTTNPRHGPPRMSSPPTGPINGSRSLISRRTTSSPTTTCSPSATSRPSTRSVLPSPATSSASGRRRRPATPLPQRRLVRA